MPSPIGNVSPSTTLALGGVRFRVALQDHYEVSVDDETFLSVSSDSSGLLVSCDVAETPLRSSTSGPWVATIRQNTITRTASGVRTQRPDPHTILVLRHDAEIFRAHCPDSQTLEIDGEMGLPEGVVRMRAGVSWPGHFIPPGPVDMTADGPGRIDFQPSGMVRIVPR